MESTDIISKRIKNRVIRRKHYKEKNKEKGKEKVLVYKLKAAMYTIILIFDLVIVQYDQSRFLYFYIFVIISL